MPRELNIRERTFIANVVAGRTYTEAARIAGFRHPGARGSMLARRPLIAAEIDRYRLELEEKTQISAQRVLWRLWNIANADPKGAYAEDGSFLPLDEMPLDVRRTIKSVTTEEKYERTGAIDEAGEPVERLVRIVTRKVEFWSKDKALELLGKHKRLFADININLDERTLDEYIAESYQLPGDAPIPIPVNKGNGHGVPH